MLVYIKPEFIYQWSIVTLAYLKIDSSKFNCYEKSVNLHIFSLIYVGYIMGQKLKGLMLKVPSHQIRLA
jgi:hypothetical protein